MTDEFHVPEWDCTDDALEATEEIARVIASGLLREFHAGEGTLNPKGDVVKIIERVVARNVDDVLKLAAKALMDRLEGGEDIREPDGRIDIREAVRIVRELDYLDEGTGRDDH